jgi:hypothetical protein
MGTIINHFIILLRCIYTVVRVVALHLLCILNQDVIMRGHDYTITVISCARPSSIHIKMMNV